MPVVEEVPEGVGREPVVAIAVEHDGVVVRDPPASDQGAEFLRAEEVPLHLVLELALPVEPDRTRDVGLGVERGILVDLHDSDRVIVQMLGDPIGGDQHVVRVISHRNVPLAACR